MAEVRHKSSTSIARKTATADCHRGGDRFDGIDFFYTCQQSNGKMTDNILITYVEIQSRQIPIRSLDDDNTPMPLFRHDGGPRSLPDLHHRFFFNVAESMMKAHKADC